MSARRKLRRKSQRSMLSAKKNRHAGINYARLTDQQLRHKARLEQRTGQFAVDQHEVRETAKTAIAATLDSVFDAIADTPEAVEFFGLFVKHATLANAKKIVAHDDCPQIVAEELQQRLDDSASSRKQKSQARTAPAKSGGVSES